MGRIGNTVLALGVILSIFLPLEARAFSLPDGYTKIEVWPCRFVLPERNIGVVDELSPVCKEALGDIFGQLGVDLDKGDGSVEVRIVADPEHMKLLAPPDSPPPDWSSAIAYPNLNLIILPLRHRNAKPVVDLDVVLEHELSHLALRLALKGTEVPRWFSEGVAVQQSEGSSLRRYWVLWRAARGGRIAPLSDLEHYPEHPGRINLAYAEAADFVGFLLRKRGWPGIRMAIRHTVQSGSFPEAIELTYDRSLSSLEKEWRKGLSGKWQWLPLLTGSGVVWGFAVVLFIVAYFAVKRRGRRRLAEMEVEESVMEQAIAHSPPPRVQAERTPAVTVGRTKIRIDDDIHTLH